MSPASSFASRRSRVTGVRGQGHWAPLASHVMRHSPAENVPLVEARRIGSCREQEEGCPSAHSFVGGRDPQSKIQAGREFGLDLQWKGRTGPNPTVRSRYWTRPRRRPRHEPPRGSRRRGGRTIRMSVPPAVGRRLGLWDGVAPKCDRQRGPQDIRSVLMDFAMRATVRGHWRLLLPLLRRVGFPVLSSGGGRPRRTCHEPALFASLQSPPNRTPSELSRGAVSPE